MIKINRSFKLVVGLKNQSKELEWSLCRKIHQMIQSRIQQNIIAVLGVLN